MNYFYAPESVTERQAIYLEIKAALGFEGRIEMYSSISEFSERLTRFNNPEIIIILAVGKKEMPSIFALEEGIFGAAMIILLSDEEPESMALAIRLKPKFIGQMTDDLDKIVPIIEKLIKKKEKKMLH